MNRLTRTVLCAVAALGAGCAMHRTKGPSAPPPETKTEVAANKATTPLLLISIDAFRADYIKRGLTPNLQALADHGVRSVGMQPSFPSLTFPNHYAIVTGMVPDHNGIVNNTMDDTQLGHFQLSDKKATGNAEWWNQATPLWVTADFDKLRTATMFWPGSDAPIQ